MPQYFVGLDLGQAADYTAVAVLERTQIVNYQRPGPVQNHYACRHLERFPLGTSYPAIVANVQKLLSKPPLLGGWLALDGTACGRPVVDLFKSGPRTVTLRAILITNGHAVATDDNGFLHAPKRELVSCVQVLLQARRLQIANALPHAALLRDELEKFRAKVSLAGHESLEDWRERDHDDLVLALALAAWLGERQPVTCAPFMLCAGPVIPRLLPS